MSTSSFVFSTVNERSILRLLKLIACDNGACDNGKIGTIQATETIKVLLNVGVSLHGRLLLLDAAAMEWRSIKLRKDPACPVCG